MKEKRRGKAGGKGGDIMGRARMNDKSQEKTGMWRRGGGSQHVRGKGECAREWKGYGGKRDRKR